MKRYLKNGILSQKEQEKISQAKVCVLGCGGLGGYILEMLARLGIGHLTLVDYDRFDASNLNRQILCTEDNLGDLKVQVANKRIQAINGNVSVTVISQGMTDKNVEMIINGHDLAMDALDTIEARLLLEDACEDLNIPLIHGAIAGWYGQVTTLLPGDRSLSKFYKNSRNRGIEETIGNPSFTPAMIASIQVSECLKVLLNKEDILSKKMLFIDLLANEFNEIPLE